jgi:putative ABC transport system permease protein
MLRRYADAFLSDVRYGLRSMVRTPGFTTVALVMIAVGTGANAAMFSVVDALLLRSPFPNPERIAIVRIAEAGKPPTGSIPLDVFRTWPDAIPAFESVGAMGSGGRLIVRGLGDLRTMNVECITAGMFRVLGTQPIAGRTFTDDEDRPGGLGAVVLSYQFWRRDLAGAPDAVGRVLTINGAASTVVGIMPQSFGGPYSRNTNDAWLPLGPGLDRPSPAGCSARSSVTVFARLKPGSTFTAVPPPVALRPVEEHTIAEVRTPILSLLGAVGLVLLIACANVANLQLERALGRRREFAVRIAIGASRGRVVRQALTENVLLCLAGGVLGVLAANWTLDLLIALLPASMPHVIGIELNVRVLAATLAIACAAGVAVGLLPAVQASSPRVVDDLRAFTGTTTASRAWIRASLVAGQIALSLILLVGAVLMIRTFLTLRPSSPGFTTADKLTAVVRLQGSRPPASPAFFSALLERVRAIPGVHGVAGSTYLPMSGSVSTVTIPAGDTSVEVYSGRVTPNYFAEMQIPLTLGRAFDDRDNSGAPPVAIVNEAMVRRLPPGQGMPGAQVTVTMFDGTSETRQIVGVVRDTRSAAYDTRVRPEIYMPFAQRPAPALNLIVRTRNPSDQRIWSGIRREVAALDSSQVADRFTPMTELLDARVKTWRFGAWMMGLFAAIAIALAVVGLTVSIASWVARRTREIGVRMALGAHPAQVTRLFLKQGFIVALIGIVLGLAGAAASTRLLQSWLYGVTPLDPPAFAWSAAAMLVVTALSAYIPARRAARVDPLTTLRAE